MIHIQWLRVTIVRIVTTSLTGLGCEKHEHVASGTHLREPCNVCNATAALPNKLHIRYSDTDTNIWKACDGGREKAKEVRLKKRVLLYCSSYYFLLRVNLRDNGGYEILEYQYNLFSGSL